MEPITPGNRNRPVPPDVYWRRRLFALAIGLAVLGLLAWAVGGASAARPAAATTSFNGQSQQPSPPPVIASPTASSASPSPAASSASPSPSPSASGPGGQPAATSGPAAGGAKDGHAVAAQNAPGDDCPTGDVVLTLTANGDDYAATARPEFTIYVVSTARHTCAFNVGSRYLTLTVESGGVRSWGSADCMRGSGTRVAMLARGVPEQRKISWDRLLSAPGCHLPRSPARPGTYTVTASDAGVHSHTLVFLLH